MKYVGNAFSLGMVPRELLGRVHYPAGGVPVFVGKSGDK